MMKPFFFFLIFTVGTALINNVSAQENDPSPLNFPTPKDIRNQLFYLQRDPNINTIIYQLNMDEQGVLIKDKPVDVFWIRYADKGEIKKLSAIQRKFAYGIVSQYIGDGQYELRLNSHKMLPMNLHKSALDNKYHVYITINGVKIQIERIFIRIDGGTLMSPNIKYVEITGYDAIESSKKIIERIKLS